MRIALVDHLVDGFSKIAVPFWGLPRFEAILTALLTEVQALEQAVIDTLAIRDLPTADLPRLTVLGKIVGESRLGRALEEYRAALSARIAANYSRGWPDDVLAVWALCRGSVPGYVGTRAYDFRPPLFLIVCDVSATLTAQPYVATIMGLLRRAMPAGIPVEVAWATPGTPVDDGFGLTDGDEDSPSFALTEMR